jgi:tetratricopeptide (TPR) repeat protein
LDYELQVMPELNAFSKNYLLENYGTPELTPKRPILYSAWGRFAAAASFLRLGWYCFGGGALLIAGYAIPRISKGKLVPVLTLFGLPLAALFIVLIPPALGQHYYRTGILAKTNGRNQEAIADFRRAMHWDLWHAQDVDLYATIGQLEKNAGIDLGSPERHILKAVNYRLANDYESALYEFSLASAAGGELGETARRETASTRLTFGLALYQAGGAGAAVTNWQLTLAEDPDQIYVLPYLSRAYYDTARYQAGIDAATRLARLISDHNYTLANAYSVAGDCYAKLGDDAKARYYYNLALAADPILNFWAVTGLAGD